MRLQEINLFSPVQVERDNEFASLGNVTHKNPQMLVFIEDEKYVKSLFENRDISSVLTISLLLPMIPPHLGVALVGNPREFFYKFHNYLATYTSFYWADFETEISSEAVIH